MIAFAVLTASEGVIAGFEVVREYVKLHWTSTPLTEIRKSVMADEEKKIYANLIHPGAEHAAHNVEFYALHNLWASVYDGNPVSFGDLRQYAASVGFVVDRRESSRGSTVMRRQHEKLIVSRKPEGVYTWWDVHSEDRGTIVDFVQREKPGLNLGGVRKELRAWLGVPAPALPEMPALVPTSPDLGEVRRRYFGMSVPSNHSYLEDERAIPAATLQHWRFAGRVRVDGYNAAVFPHFDAENEVCGYELKNRGGFTGFAQGGRKGIWLSNTGAHDRRLILAESGIDAISHAVLFDDPSARYGSIGGRPTTLQLEIIRKVLAAMPESAEIVAAMDADQAGRELADLIEAVYGRCGRGDLTFRRHEPEGAEDWNDLLKARRNNPPLPASSPEPRLA